MENKFFFFSSSFFCVSDLLFHLLKCEFKKPIFTGIDCPRGSRPAPGGGPQIPSDPYGEEALMFTKELCIQREVRIFEFCFSTHI